MMIEAPGAWEKEIILTIFNYPEWLGIQWDVKIRELKKHI